MLLDLHVFGKLSRSFDSDRCELSGLMQQQKSLARQLEQRKQQCDARGVIGLISEPVGRRDHCVDRKRRQPLTDPLELLFYGCGMDINEVEGRGSACRRDRLESCLKHVVHRGPILRGAWKDSVTPAGRRSRAAWVEVAVISIAE